MASTPQLQPDPMVAVANDQSEKVIEKQGFTTKHPQEDTSRDQATLSETAIIIATKPPVSGNLRLEDLEKHDWMIRPVVDTSDITGRNKHSTHERAITAMNPVRRDSFMSVVTPVNHFEAMDMANWAWGPLQGP